MQATNFSGISARDLHVWRGDRHVLRGVSMDAAAGDCVHVAGPNGSGKTTFLRVVAGLLNAGDTRSGLVYFPPPQASGGGTLTARVIDLDGSLRYTVRVPLAVRRSEEIGELVRYLATAKGSFMTGAIIEFSGGWPAGPKRPE